MSVIQIYILLPQILFTTSALTFKSNPVTAETSRGFFLTIPLALLSFLLRYERSKRAAVGPFTIPPSPNVRSLYKGTTVASKVADDTHIRGGLGSSNKASTLSEKQQWSWPSREDEHFYDLADPN